MDITDDDDEFYEDDEEIIEDIDFLNEILPQQPSVVQELIDQHIERDTDQSLEPESSIDTLSDEQIRQEEAKLIEQFSFEIFTQELLRKAGTGDLQAQLHSHWSKYVPCMFKVTENPLMNLIEDKENIDGILLKPLEQFILSSSNMDSIKQTKSELCGKVFKSGEPTYSCRDCGTDPTCVLCWMCFKNSAHRLHKYKMMTSSGGGGYCDCGDAEAWKQHPNCDIHAVKKIDESATVSQSETEQLPSDLVHRTRQLFEFLFDYITEVLIMTDDKAECLPAHLKPTYERDDYVTVLYNDEIHSYEQVVSTLKKVVACDDKKAFDYAAIVDKEGRSVIKRGRRVECAKVRDKVQTTMMGHHNVTPLKTKVMHSTLASHQYFAETLVKWLQSFTQNSTGLKEILCQIGFNHKQNTNLSVVEKIMLSDCILWKSARSCFHQYFISIYFMSTIWKREFAVLYTRNYQTIWRNHVKNPDDTVSLTDLSVQLFTVISLSKYLIENENLFQILIDTIIEHSRSKLNEQLKLSFTRRQRANHDFKRAQFIIYDVKYCLINPPDVWTDRLRDNFLNGFKSFIEFLKYMQGMDAVKRYTDQHIEYEPEWETGFNLLIKLQKPIESLIDWCVCDERVLSECIRLLVECLKTEHTYKYLQKRFLKHDYELVDNDINKEYVSIHAPLTRLLTALCVESHKTGLTSVALRIFNDTFKMIDFMEPALCSLVLVSQTNSGLWRRNGYSLLSQVYFYTNIKCRLEMYDRDVQALQIAASQMGSNDFIVNVLARFKLLDYWTKENPEGKTEEMKVEYLNQVAEDFLQLLIILISERYDVCLPSNGHPQTNYDKLKNEVIHQLCIQSSISHSDLIKNIFPDNNEVTRSLNDFEAVLKDVANFKHSNDATKKGTYELKMEHYADYNPYYYHYTKIEKTKSEDEVLKRTQGKQYHIPPVNKPLFMKEYSKVRSLLDSDVLLKILTTIIERYHMKSAQNASSQKVPVTDGQLLRALYLLAMGLNEEKQTRQYGEPFSLSEKLVKLKYSENLKNYLSTIEINGDFYKSLVDYIMTTLFEDSSVASTSGASPTKVDDEKEKRKSAKAEQRRNKILAQMNEMQKKFIQNHQEFFEEQQDDTANAADVETKRYDENSMDFKSNEEESSVCLGPHKSQLVSQTPATANQYRCILCQEDQEIKLNSAQQMVLCSYVQHSKVLSRDRKQNFDTENTDMDLLLMRNQLNWGIHTSSCGHVMHSNCWQNYVEGIRTNENRRNGRYMNISTKRNEYLCPLCETIGNSVLPVIPTQQTQQKSTTQSFNQHWPQFLQTILSLSLQKETNPDDVTKETLKIKDINIADVLNQLNLNTADILKQNDNDELTLNQDTINTYDIYARSLFVFGMIQHPNDDDARMILSIFNNCSYVIQTLEQSLRIDQKPLSNQLPLGQLNLLKNLINYTIYYTINKKQYFNEYLKLYFYKILSSLIPFRNETEKWFDGCGINLLDHDLFNTLVTLTYLFRYLFKELNENCIYFNLFKFLFKLHCIQIIVNLIKANGVESDDGGVADASMDKSMNENWDDSGDFSYLAENQVLSENEQSKIFDLYSFILSNFSNVKTEYTRETLVKQLKVSLMPFLRCSVLFFEHLTNIQPLPDTIGMCSTTLSSMTEDLCESNFYLKENENFDYYCKYLGLFGNGCDLSELFDIENDNSLKQSIQIWCRNTESNESRQMCLKYPLNVNQFIQLPYDYIDLVNNFANISTISTSENDTSTASILCLICGEFLRGQTYGGFSEQIGTTRVGTCTAHAYKCSRTSGLFLRISECQILLLHLNINAENEIHVMGSFVPAPYLDDYGETDQGLRRGNPLRFCAQRYKKLHKLWLNHSISDEVYRVHQNNQSVISNVDWVLL